MSPDTAQRNLSLYAYEGSKIFKVSALRETAGMPRNRGTRTDRLPTRPFGITYEPWAGGRPGSSDTSGGRCVRRNSCSERKKGSHQRSSTNGALFAHIIRVIVGEIAC